MNQRDRASGCLIADRFNFITDTALWEEVDENVNAMANKLRLYDNFDAGGTSNLPSRSGSFIKGSFREGLRALKKLSFKKT